MAQYPEPEQYARAAASHAAIAFDRTERVQRSEGVRLADHADGGQRPARRYDSGNAPVAEGSPTELLDTVPDPAGAPVEQVAIERADADRLLRQCFAGVDATDRQLLELADGHGYTVTELAELFGTRRETLSRRINRTRRQVQQNGTAMAPSGQG